MATHRTIGFLGSALLLALAGCGGSGGSSTGLGGSGDAVPALSTSAEGAATATSPALAASPNAPAGAPILIESKTATASNFDVGPFRTRDAKQAPVPARIVLPALAARNPANAVAKSAQPGQFGTPTLIGNAREVVATAAPQQVADMLGWAPTANGGRIAAMRFQSTGAKGVRVGLLVRSLPLGGVVRFYADGGDKVYEVANQEIQATIDRNLASGNANDAARTFWSPDLGGEAVTVEFEVPANVPMDALQVSVPSLSHIFAAADDVDAIRKVGEAASCNLDVSCTSAYNDTSKSVALMNFVADGSGDTIPGTTYICTGTLLNDITSSGTPYFLSANHCISTQTVASSLWTRWFYKSAACNSSLVNPASVWTKTGATLLYASSDTDTSFMRLASAPPTGASFAASTNAGVSAGAGVYGVHHPKGDLQKYSVGTTSGAAGTCDGANCSLTTSANFWKVDWTSGTTQGGSSGSGLFTQRGGKNYLIGQLYGGSASCDARGAADYYGRFDTAYNQALYQWLGGVPARVPVYRFYNTRTGSHFYTTSAAERNRIMSTLPQYSYDGITFYAMTVGGSPVYRFYNTRTGAHFYTVDAAERNNVLAKFPWYNDEGVAWYAGNGPTAGGTPLYRFYNNKTASHFYTVSAGERDTVAQTLPQYSYEGIVYYAWLSP